MVAVMEVSAEALGERIRQKVNILFERGDLDDSARNALLDTLSPPAPEVDENDIWNWHAKSASSDPATDTTPEVVVTQADRDAAAEIWNSYVAKIGEVIAEKAIREGASDDTMIVQAFASHRTEAEARGRREALEEVIAKIGSMKTGRSQPIVMTCAEIIDELKRLLTEVK